MGTEIGAVVIDKIADKQCRENCYPPTADTYLLSLMKKLRDGAALHILMPCLLYLSICARIMVRQVKPVCFGRLKMGVDDTILSLYVICR